MKQAVLIMLMGLMVIFPGCEYRSKKIRRNIREKSNSSLNLQTHLVKELEAKVYDIPVPFHTDSAQLMSDPSSADNYVMLRYITTQSATQLIDLYIYEMELQGWNKVAFCPGKETFFYFEKPSRWASVLIRNSALDHITSDQELLLCFGKKLDTTEDFIH